jgi:putative glutamine amidotransferase
MKPIIGITCDIEERNGRAYVYTDIRYGRLVEEAGGIPILIHPTGSIKEIISKIDGLLLSGGEDIHPKYYREELSYPVTLSPDMRTEFEVSLLGEALRAKIPVLGICHGMQLINIAFGGTLYQDLPSQTEGVIDHRLGDRRHQVAIEEDSLLFKIMGKREVSVTSTHHQAVKDLGSGLRVGAVAHDSIIEAFEMPGYPFLIGVQWHPEKEPDVEAKRLLSAFAHAPRTSF